MPSSRSDLSVAEQVRAFHAAFDLVIRDTPTVVTDDDEIDLRTRLLLEEVEELHQSMQDGDLTNVARELADILCVTYGTALHYGIDLDAVVAEVMRSNMTKLWPDGRPRHNSGKVVKPPAWAPPNIDAVIGEAA